MEEGCRVEPLVTLQQRLINACDDLACECHQHTEKSTPPYHC